MTTYVVRRLLLMIGTLFVVSIINFILIQLPYGDVYNALEQQLEEAGEGAAAAELRESMDRLRKLHGLDKPPVVRYFTWLGKFVQGDFGVSVINSRPVASLIGDRLLLTFIVAITALLFTWIVGIVIGVLTAVYRNTLFDHVFTFVGFIGLSVPNFLFALVLLFASVFYFNTPSVGGLFSPEYVGAPWTLGKVVDLLRKLWVPVVVIGTAGTAGTIRVMRGNLLDMLNDESVKVARAKGLQEWVVVVKYAVRVAINPLVSSFGMAFPTLLAGETITAIVLGLPTTGPLLFQALLSQDMNLAGALLFFLALMLLVGNLIADALLAWLDPRIRYE